MKLIIAILLFLPFNLFAQGFEGTIVWTVKMDDATRAKMEKANKELSNPANQEKLKQLEAQMNSPEFKAMMEKNPQMKTQLENAKKALLGGNITSMLPQGMTIKIKGTNSLVVSQGGAFGSEILTIGSKKQSYLIDREAKTYSLLPVSDSVSKPQGKYDIKKTAETKKILDYNCTKYDVTYTDESGRSVTQHIWTTNDLKGFDLKTLARQSGNKNPGLNIDGLEGFPLEMEFDNPQMKFGMEVTSLKKETLPASDFTLPAGFTEKK